jgi:outer membrane receptor protein involved in Fe transport
MFDASLNASWLIDYELQATPTTASRDYVGIAGQPVDLRGRAALNWSRESLGAIFALNFVGPYKSETGADIDGLTTADLQLRWSPDIAALKGLTLTASVQNLFDTDPPFYDSPTGVGYDAANAEPLGRFTSIQLTKRW